MNVVYEGDTFDSITGPVYFSYDAYKLVPRSDDDLVGYDSVITAVDELAAVPGVIAKPESPPAKSALGESSANPPSGASVLWHPAQCACRIGATSC